MRDSSAATWVAVVADGRRPVGGPARVRRLRTRRCRSTPRRTGPARRSSILARSVRAADRVKVSFWMPKELEISFLHCSCYSESFS